MNLIDQNVNVLNDAKLYLEAISADAYSAQIELMSNATIGQHTRHFVEFYQCLLQQANHPAIDYDARQRNMLIESNPLVAIGAIDSIMESLGSLDISDTTVVCTCNSTDHKIKSTIGRELLYNLEHCIHHLALVKIGLRMVAPEIKLPSHFGFAPSTLVHRERITS